MSAQETRIISKEEAIKKYVTKYLVYYSNTLAKEAFLLENKELENAIKEEFYNYKIINN